MKMKLSLGLGLIVALASCQKAEQPSLRVSAASSLADALHEIDVAFTQKTGVQVALNLGASSSLQRQILEGAPCDVFFSADATTMDALDARGLLQSATREDQLSNSLVVVIPVASGLELVSEKGLTDTEVKRIATGNPASVPVGVYAKSHFEKLGYWNAIESKIVACENARAALAALESGNVDVAIVYKTDAALSQKVKIAFEIPAEAGPKIIYPMAALKAAARPDAARQYLDFLDSEASHAVFAKFGFIVLPEE